jgi:hypothetical protein
MSPQAGIQPVDRNSTELGSDRHDRGYERVVPDLGVPIEGISEPVAVKEGFRLGNVAIRVMIGRPL